MICDRLAIMVGCNEEVVQRKDLAAVKVQLSSSQPNGGEPTSLVRINALLSCVRFPNWQTKALNQSSVTITFTSTSIT